jgi:uncharacterized membrane protein|tara:strand:- start:11 stop:169 length:159 start_codon:yes stop_codon:yes gene_type:complete
MRFFSDLTLYVLGGMSVLFAFAVVAYLWSLVYDVMHDEYLPNYDEDEQEENQ